MQRRNIVVSLAGPWGPNRSTTYIKARIEFSTSYPDNVPPTILLDRTAALTDDTVNRMNCDISEITSGFLSRQRSSLEAILRYLLGEQSLEESLLWLKKHQQSVDLDSSIDIELSSSDEDDEVLGNNVVSKIQGIEDSDLMAIKRRAQNNPPLPKACGALWAHNGCLVCFFPPKQEKEPSLLNLSLLASECSYKNRKSLFESFGQFHNASSRKKQPTSTLETIESGDSESEEISSSSSSSSSSSDDSGLPRHHFMPNMAWRGDESEIYPGVPLDGSQKSSSGIEMTKSTASKGKNFISIQDYSSLLPARKHLAQEYILGGGFRGYSHNAEVAHNIGDIDLADVWSFVDLMLQNKVPLDMADDHRNVDSTQNLDVMTIDPVWTIARRSLSKLRSKDSAIDLSFDGKEEEHRLAVRGPIRWGRHPFGRRYLVDAL